MATRAAALRALPSVDALLRDARAEPLLQCYARAVVTEALRDTLGEARAALGNGTPAPAAHDLVARAAARLAALAAPSLRPVVNASGVVLHTNLGRAALADAAVAAVTAVAAQACNLEVDLAGGGRGERDAHVERLLCDLTGAEAAAVVNNNAAAVLLALNTLAEGREVVVSRGELVEIGGAFRIPDVLGKSGALLREVGTTNRTHARDYERAIGERTGLLLKVHPSNYRIAGFTAAVDLGALVDLGARRGVPVMEDLGSGALVDLTSYGLPPEPVVAERVRLGAAVVSFSADKLLGGPQAGILVGRASVIDRMRQNPLRRALRCDKLTLAALEATLRLYRTSPDLAAALPTLRWLTRPLAEMDTVGAVAVALLQRGPRLRVRRASGRCRVADRQRRTADRNAGHQSRCHHARDALAAGHRRALPRQRAADHRRVSADQFLLDLRCITHAADLVPRRVANPISTIKTPPHQEDA
jgi:L-seryl-tRNA(Ser) seleniumtransferase